MTILSPFAPSFGKGQVVAPAAGSATISVGVGNRSLALSNQGTNPCYVRVGPAATVGAATTADYCVPAGVQMVISKDPLHDSLSHISPVGTTLHVIPGEGF
jgi:hypothetical protein